MFAIDAHLDLSMNALEWNRDLRASVAEINARETARGWKDKPDRGNATVAFPELRRGRFGLVVATQIGRFVAADNPLPGWHSPEQAWAQTQGQLAWYRAMEEAGELVQIVDRQGLESHVARWMGALRSGADTTRLPIGYILSLEGADSLITLGHLERAYGSGLRALGPGHYGPGRYAHGTDSSAPLNAAGKELLREMDRLGMILDATHLCDEAFWTALEVFQGPVWASHNNCRALVDHNRQFSDAMIRALVARGAVIGGALDAWMMVPGWVRGKSLPEPMGCNLEVMLDHLDHICQIAGNADHIGIGSDLDGAYGREQSPSDLETIADLERLPAMLSARGYSPPDIEKVMHGNWLRCLLNAWPA
ncbi:MAG: peptidase M19 [Planctomycetota bacterium]|nr:MAG: peptidase M19 [Planctomycetota bacterium]